MKALPVALALTCRSSANRLPVPKFKRLRKLAPADDHESVFRLHPDLKTVRLLVVPPAEIKPGYVYSYYSTN